MAKNFHISNLFEMHEQSECISKLVLKYPGNSEIILKLVLKYEGEANLF